MNDELKTVCGLIILNVLVGMSAYQGIRLLLRYRAHHRRADLIAGSVFTFLVPAALLGVMYKLLVLLQPFATPEEVVDDTRSAISTCYMYGPMLLLERSMLQKLRQRWLRFKHRGLLSAATRDALQRRD